MFDLFVVLFLSVLRFTEACMQLYFLARILGTRAKLIHYAGFLFWYTLLSCGAAFTNQYFLGTIAVVGMMLLYGRLVLRAEWGSAALGAVLMEELMQLGFGVVNSLLGFVSPLTYRIGIDGISIWRLEPGTVFALVLIFLFGRLICGYFADGKLDQNKNLLLILTPCIMIGLVSEYVNHSVYSNIVQINQRGQILGAPHGKMLLLLIFCIGSIFCILYAYRRLLRSAASEHRLALLEQESAFQKRYVSEAKLRYEKTASLRHDIQNHFVILKGLLQKGDIEQAEEYAAVLSGMSEELSFSYRTGYPVLDVLLESKLSYAKHSGIRVECSFWAEESGGIEAIDFCILLSNILDNAINACQAAADSQKYLILDGSRQGDFYMVQAENGCRVSAPDGRKENKSKMTYGTGLTNIKTVVEKYHGTMSIEQEPEVFRICTLLLMK